MKRKPKVGDTVFVVQNEKCKKHYCNIQNERNCDDIIIGERVITKVGREYFYCDIHDYGMWKKEVAVEIDSYYNGCWREKSREIGNIEFLVFFSEDVYTKQLRKNQIIEKINRANMRDMSCAKIEKMYALIFETPHNYCAENWEVTE